MLANLLKIYRDSNNLDFEKIWKEAIFIFDTNVLLDLYRLPKSASDDLMKLLAHPAFNSQIWTGLGVIIEFLNNRHDVIAEQKTTFSTVKSIVEKAISSYDEIGLKLIEDIDKLKLKKRHSAIDPDPFISNDALSKNKEFLKGFIDQLDGLSAKQADVNDVDPVKDFVFKVFDKKIGSGLQKEEVVQICKDGAQRFDSELPPGYMDKKKTGSYRFLDIEYPCKYGDLVLWKEIIKHAKDKNAKFLVLITGDVKEDWWLRKRGKTIGPRPELLNEIYMEVPDLEAFHMYDTSSFLRYAKEYLNIEIKESSITEAGDLVRLNQQQHDKNEERLEYRPGRQRLIVTHDELTTLSKASLLAANLRSSLLSFREIWGEKGSNINANMHFESRDENGSHLGTDIYSKADNLRNDLKVSMTAEYISNYLPLINKLCKLLFDLNLPFIQDIISIISITPQSPGDVKIIIDSLSNLIEKIEG